MDSKAPVLFNVTFYIAEHIHNVLSDVRLRHRFKSESPAFLEQSHQLLKQAIAQKATEIYVNLETAIVFILGGLLQEFGKERNLHVSSGRLCS